MPHNSSKRHQLIERFDNLSVFIYDPYSIAISKIARGFETDLQDILFLLQEEIILLPTLEKFYQDTLKVAWDFDINPKEMETYFKTLLERFKSN